MAENKQVLLSVEDLQKFGDSLKNITAQLNLQKLAIDGVQYAYKQDTTVFMWLAGDFFNTIHELTENLVGEIDTVAFQLLECDNPEVAGGKTS